MASMDPPGFLRKDYDVPLTVSAGANEDRDAAMLSARAMELARGQIGGIFQTALVLYMFVGNQLNLFSIIFLLNMGTTPIKNLLATEQTFSALAGPKVSLFLPKLIYIALNLVGVAIFAWKVRAMGLLPVTSSDWVSLFPARAHSEYSSVATEVNG